MTLSLRRTVLIVIGVACAFVTGLTAQTQMLGPSRYLCFDAAATTATGDCLDRDSPFKDVSFGWFHFNDYEDLQTASTGVTMTADCGTVTGLGCPYLSTLKWADSLTDSVDEDDGAFDGFGQTIQGPEGERGQTIQAVGATGILFTFDVAILGDLPTHAGIVWTDGEGLLQFEAWDAGGVSLGTLQADIEDGWNLGATAEDHFFGVVHDAGISAIWIATAAGNIEVDHLQYGNPVCIVDATCDDGNACTMDVCAAGTCQWTPVTGDADGDGASCPQDCDDANPDIHPGAPEINDGIDNQCAGDPGFGLVDELLPGSVFDTQPQTKFCWPSQEGASRYQVARSLRTLAGDIVCEMESRNQTCHTDRETPEPGVVSYFLARAVEPGAGSWGQGEHRAEGCVFEDCSDGLDNDLDGFIDCSDKDDCSDPVICPEGEFRFVDTPAIDLETDALLSFFGGLALQGTEYLFFSVDSPSGLDEICVQRADFYRDSYLALTTAPYGTADSGDWEKYYRPQGGLWVGPITESHTNYFGQIWLTTGSWAIEAGMGGVDLWVSPGWWQQPPEVDGSRLQCSGASTECIFTLRVAPTRLEACGF